MDTKRYEWRGGVSLTTDAPADEALARVEAALEAINRDPDGPRIWIDRASVSDDKA